MLGELCVGQALASASASASPSDEFKSIISGVLSCRGLTYPITSHSFSDSDDEDDIVRVSGSLRETNGIGQEVISSRGTALLEPGMSIKRDSSRLVEVLTAGGNEVVKSIVSLLSTTRTSESLEELELVLNTGDSALSTN